MNRERIEVLGLRWEFVRRNPEYRQDYQRVQELREKAKHPPGSVKKKTFKFGKKTVKIDMDLYHDSSEYREEEEICRNWGISSMINPEDSFFELMGKRGESSVNKVMLWAKQLWLFHAMEHSAVLVRGEFEKPDDEVWAIVEKGDLGFTTAKSGYSRLRVYIDFGRVNSLADLKSSISTILDNHFANFVEKKQRTLRKKAYKIDYNLLLRVGDMKEKEGLTNQQIAKKIEPRKFRENPESATRTVSHLYRRYKDLVCGGYKLLTYP